MHGFVLLQTDCVSKGFAADGTRKGPGAAVGPADVHLQPVRRGEDLPKYAIKLHQLAKVLTVAIFV